MCFFYDSVILFTKRCSSPSEHLTFNALFLWEHSFVHLKALRGSELHLVRTVGMVRLDEILFEILRQKMALLQLKCVIHHERDVREEQHHTYMWRKQAITEWLWHVNFVVACCHSAKLSHMPLGISDRNKWCCDQNVKVVPGSAFTQRTCDRCVRCKKEGMFLKPLRWCCVKCVIQSRTGCAWRTTPYIYVPRTSNNRVIMACELHCCLLPHCEALPTCRSGFPIATALTLRPPPQVYCSPSSAPTNVVITSV